YAALNGLHPQIAFIDTASNSISQTLTLPSVYPSLWGSAAVSPDGKTIAAVFTMTQLGTYNTNSNVYLIDRVSRSVRGVVPLLDHTPPGDLDICFGAAGAAAYVTGPDEVVVIDAVNRRIAGTLAMPTPSRLTASPNGSWLFVTTAASGQLFRVDLATG